MLPPVAAYGLTFPAQQKLSASDSWRSSRSLGMLARSLFLHFCQSRTRAVLSYHIAHMSLLCLAMTSDMTACLQRGDKRSREHSLQPKRSKGRECLLLLYQFLIPSCVQRLTSYDWQPDPKCGGGQKNENCSNTKFQGKVGVGA